MLSRTVCNLVGQIQNGLRLDTILRYDAQGLPVYGALCLQCGARDVPVPHRLARLGVAQCIASAHVRSDRPTQNTAQAHAVLTTEAAAEVALLSAPHEAERRKHAKQEAAESQQAERDYLRYARHAVLHEGCEAGQLITKASWHSMGYEGRERILRIIEGESNC